MLNLFQEATEGAVGGEKTERPKQVFTWTLRDTSSPEKEAPACTGPDLPRPSSPVPCPGQGPRAPAAIGPYLGCSPCHGSRFASSRTPPGRPLRNTRPLRHTPALALSSPASHVALPLLGCSPPSLTPLSTGRARVDPHAADPALKGSRPRTEASVELERRSAQFREAPDEKAAEHRHVPALILTSTTWPPPGR